MPAPTLIDVDQDYDRLVEDVRSAQKAIAALRGTAESEDGTVSATVDVHGSLIDLDLSPRIYRSPDSEALAATILATVTAARREVRDRAEVELAPWLPADAGREPADFSLDPVLQRLRPRDHQE